MLSLVGVCHCGGPGGNQAGNAGGGGAGGADSGGEPAGDANKDGGPSSDASTDGGPSDDASADGAGGSDVTEGGASEGGEAGTNDAAIGDATGDVQEAGTVIGCLGPDPGFAWPVPPKKVTVPADASWKSSIAVPNEPFLANQVGTRSEIGWVKFIIMLSEPDKVYFQDSKTYPFHYDFAVERIPAFQGMTHQQFDAVTLRREGQQAVLGAVLVPNPGLTQTEYGIELVLNDAAHPELVATLVRQVVEHVQSAQGSKGYYLPTATQRECLDAHRSYLSGQGIETASVDRWLSGDACYAPGWAIGKLVKLASSEVDAAYLDGRLRAEDILLLSDSAVAELPYVAGVLTLAPSTPNSHPAILARSYSIPFAYARREEAVSRANQLVSHQVVLSTGSSDAVGGCAVKLVDVEGIEPAARAQIRALSSPPPIEVKPKRAAGATSLSIEGLTPTDIDRVGGKAANFGLVRAAVPAQSPSPAIAFTFDVWDAFFAQPAPNGQSGTLGDEVARRLAPHPWPADPAALDQTLEGIRKLIRNAPFPASLRSEVLTALTPFEPTRRIRFRSSTNVEDSETFTGAGLYDSVTGCLADDLDGDSSGPSGCNAAEAEERGVLRAIQRVYSSFYNRNAAFERLRRGVNESQVGMGVLVHYSVPDEQELANGVATLTRGYEGVNDLELVTQVGAVSVTNPDGSALPETVTVTTSGGSSYLQRSEGSSLVPLGQAVLSWETEYRTLTNLLVRVADRYAGATGHPLPFALDFEYKKVEPGQLSIRQVRPIPLPDTTQDVTPFLVGAPITLCVRPTEWSDAFALHRLKARLALDPADLWATATELEKSLYAAGSIDYLQGTTLEHLEGAPASFPGAAHSAVSPEAGGKRTSEWWELRDSWAAGGAQWTLTTRLPDKRSREVGPVLAPDDLRFAWSVSWPSPVPFLDWDGTPSTRTEDSVDLGNSCPDTTTIGPLHPLIEKTLEGPKGTRVETAYWFPTPPQGPTAGYTAPPVKWRGTTITGLASAPIVLHGYYSQTHAPYHHNFGGAYLFDPRLEPGIASSVLDELAAANVAFLFIRDGSDSTTPPAFWIGGLDGTLRPL